MENHIDVIIDNLKLPTKIVNLSSYSSNSSNLDLNSKSDYTLILGHGLGTNGPKKRDHTHDKWISMIWNNLKEESNISIIAYTARGHGNSSGWEEQENEEKLITQFTWENLANDMINISNYFSITSFIAGGQSMGSATALYTAIKFSNKVSALILVRPPTAWEVRDQRRDHLIDVANQYKKKHPHDLSHNVFRGAAMSDLPPINSQLYSLITCPVLILCHDGDSAHPISTGQTLSTLLSNCQLIITQTHEEALITWPQIIKQFIYSLPPTNY